MPNEGRESFNAYENNLYFRRRRDFTELLYIIKFHQYTQLKGNLWIQTDFLMVNKYKVVFNRINLR